MSGVVALPARTCLLGSSDLADGARASAGNEVLDEPMRKEGRSSPRSPLPGRRASGPDVQLQQGAAARGDGGSMARAAYRQDAQRAVQDVIPIPGVLRALLGRQGPCHRWCFVSCLVWINRPAARGRFPPGQEPAPVPRPYTADRPFAATARPGSIKR